MRTLLQCALLIILCQTTSPSATAAPPEALLPAESLAYLRFDGVKPHRAAYAKTVFAQVFRDELSPLADWLIGLAVKAAGKELLDEKALAAMPADELIKLQASIRHIPTFGDYLLKHGAAAGVEVVAPLAGRYQVTIVFPQANTPKYRSAVLGAFRVFGRLTQSRVTTAKSSGRLLLQMEAPENYYILCWPEGEHVVMTVGTEPIEHTLGLATGKRKSLADQPIFKSLAGFDDYTTCSRGFVHFGALNKLFARSLPPAAAVMKALGLDGLDSFQFHIGAEGKYLRSTLIVDTPGERKGLLSLLTPPKDFDPSKHPPLPPDASLAIVAGFDPAKAWDAILAGVEGTATALVGPGAAGEIRKELEGFEKHIGLEIKGDLIDTLGSSLVVSNSSSEGFLIFGLTVSISVRDAEQLKSSLSKLVGALNAAGGDDVSVRTRKYRGAELNVMTVSENGFPFTPSWTVHDGWLTVGFHPQPVQGVIARRRGGYKVWKRPELVDKALAAARRSMQGEVRVAAISVTDPRPPLKFALSFAPLFMSMLSRELEREGVHFDPTLIPNASLFTDKLSENVAVAVDNGVRLRVEGYSTFPTVLPLSGMELIVPSMLGFWFWAF